MNDGERAGDECDRENGDDRDKEGDLSQKVSARLIAEIITADV